MQVGLPKSKDRLQKQPAIIKILMKLIIDNSNRDTGTKIQELQTLNSQVAILVSEVNSKIYKLRLYNEVINNLIYYWHSKKIIKKGLQNLGNY